MELNLSLNEDTFIIITNKKLFNKQSKFIYIQNNCTNKEKILNFYHHPILGCYENRVKKKKINDNLNANTQF